MAKIKKPQKRGAQLVHGVDRLQKWWQDFVRFELLTSFPTTSQRRTQREWMETLVAVEDEEDEQEQESRHSTDEN
jgi:hypothetical protein